MSRSARDLAMLAEMGLHWPEGQAVPVSMPPRGAQGTTAAAPADSAEPAIPQRPAEPVVAVQRSEDAAAAVPAGRVLPIGEAPALAAGLDWAALRAAVSTCEACNLCQTRRQTVFGVGAETARWMVIGEAPGEQEDRQGEPFVGPAGQLLDRMLQAIGLSRSDGSVFITNTIKCRPPQNRNPQPEELQACAAHLARQIELVQPQIVLAMGRFAAQQLLKTDQPLGRLRGQVHAMPGRPEVSVVVTYHPAYLLRYPADKGKAWEDLCRAVDAAAVMGLRAGSGAPGSA